MAFGLFNVLCVVALFRWKKWGFYGLFGSTIVILVLNLSVGIGIGSFAGFVTIVITFLVMRSSWSLFE
jgi:hypothetical protein